MRTFIGAAALVLASVMASGALAQVTSKGPLPLNLEKMQQKAARTVDICVNVMEPRTEAGKTIVIGSGFKPNADSVNFYLTATEFRASVNVPTAVVPHASSGWDAATLPPQVAQLHVAAAGGAMVRLTLSASSTDYQPVTRVTYYYQSPTCIGVHG